MRLASSLLFGLWSLAWLKDTSILCMLVLHFCCFRVGKGGARSGRGKEMRIHTRRLLCVAAVVYALLPAVEAAATNKPKGAVYDGKTWHTVTYDKPGAKPPPIVSDSWKRPDTRIFVGIAQYRDQRCVAKFVLSSERDLLV